MIYHDTGGWLAVILLINIHSLEAIILSGAPNSYARYPKWAHSFENSLSFEFKTEQSYGLLFYTDDGGVNGNFYAISISDGRVQLDFRGLSPESKDLLSFTGDLHPNPKRSDRTVFCSIPMTAAP